MARGRRQSEGPRETAIRGSEGDAADIGSVVGVQLSDALRRYRALETQLCAQLLEREEVVRAALIAILARQHMVLLGPPGTAKSQLVALLAQRISSPTGGLRYFIWLMTRFTTPDEIFGPISVTGLRNDEYRRITAGKAPEAELVFLDEPFKASSAILNSLLTLMNERAFDNGSARVPVPLISLFGASNEMPQGEDLQALWDRFSLRLQTAYLSDGGFSRLLRATVAATPVAHFGGSQVAAAARVAVTRDELLALQSASAGVTIADAMLGAIEQLRKDLKAKGIIASDRRWVQSLALLRAHALLEGRNVVEEDDLLILRDVLWQTPEQRQDIGRVVAHLANPLNARAEELADQAASVHKAFLDVQNDAGKNDAEKMQAALEAFGKFKSNRAKLAELQNAARTQGRNTVRIDRAYEQVTSMFQEVVRLAGVPLPA
ncbi:MAG: AAA family ATPase [Chloroflexi bacterium]|nr:AAA family ATPase [Chloroflexota bacterium]